MKTRILFTAIILFTLTCSSNLKAQVTLNPLQTAHSFNYIHSETSHWNAGEAFYVTVGTIHYTITASSYNGGTSSEIDNNHYSSAYTKIWGNEEDEVSTKNNGYQTKSGTFANDYNQWWEVYLEIYGGAYQSGRTYGGTVSCNITW